MSGWSTHLPSPIRSRGVSESPRGRLVLRRLDSALRPKEGETVSWRPHHRMSENAAGGPGGAAVSHGVRTQWQRAGTVQPLCSQTPRLPLGCAAAGPELAGSERPIRAGPAQGSLGARLQGLPAPRGAAARWACVAGLGGRALVSTSPASTFHAGDMPCLFLTWSFASDVFTSRFTCSLGSLRVSL